LEEVASTVCECFVFFPFFDVAEVVGGAVVGAFLEV